MSVLVRIASPSSTTAGRTSGSVDGGAMRTMRRHSLMDLEREREPSLDQLLKERDPRFYVPLGEWMERRLARLVRERDASK